MPIYNSAVKVQSGVPLGGVGAGKMEILPNGLFNAFTFLNNWTQPFNGAAQYPGILGYHLAAFAESKACLLQTEPLAGLPIVKQIRYDGLFPKVTLTYAVPQLGAEICLEGFSPLIPGDTKNSALPCAIFSLKVKNLRKSRSQIGLLFIGRNIVGDWCVGRQNRIEEDGSFVHLEFLNTKAAKDDARKGQIRFSFQKSGWQTTYLECWNAVTKNFHFGPQEIRLSAWDLFAREGRLPNSIRGYVAEGENQELLGAVAAYSVFKAGEEKSWKFTAAWHFPQHPFGHRYVKYFKNASDVQRYVAPRRSALKKKVDRFHTLVARFPFPAWFKDALLTSLAPFFASSWCTQDNRFAFYEAPVVCPLMGTLDVGFYGSIPLGYFFPEWEKSQLWQFAKAQRANGYIPHDLGRNRIDIPSNGTTFYYWKDLNPKFTLMAYRDALWSQDWAFLRKIYPHVKKAMRWSFQNDPDGNGLPDHEGADQTFDLWDFRGTNAYTASLFLAALLASVRMAEKVSDTLFARECARRFEKGRTSFERELWNGEFFGDTACTLSQLNGQWYADLLNLGDIADPAKLEKALHTIGASNSRHSRFGLVNSVLGKKLDESNSHARNIWFGMNYAWISLCVSRGFPLKKALNPARQLWDNVISRQRNPWNQPDMIDSKTGRYVFGDAYYRNMAIWSIPIAYAKRDKETARLLSQLKGMR